MRRVSLGLLAALVLATPAFADGDAAAGKKAFESRCVACHSLDPAAKKLGPTLHGVVGRKGGTVEGYRYSQAAKTSGLTFDAATLETYLTKPSKLVPGTLMMFSVPDAKMRADIIAYLSTNP